MKNIVVLISGEGSNLQAMIDACASGQISGKICAVISNNADAYGLVRAKKAGIPSFVFERKAYETFNRACGIYEYFNASIYTTFCRENS